MSPDAVTAFAREVPWRDPQRFVPYRRALAMLVRVSVAMVALGTTVTVFTPPRIMCGCSESKTDIAKATVMKYAYEAYPSWAVAHPDASYPRELADLNEYMNNKDIKDPWGTPYVLLCGRELTGPNGIAVISAGEDGVFGTDDDIRSYE